MLLPELQSEPEPEPELYPELELQRGKEPWPKLEVEAELELQAAKGLAHMHALGYAHRDVACSMRTGAGEGGECNA